MRKLFYLICRLSVMAVVIAAVICARAYAVIPGVPETRPGTASRYALTWSNDFFALPMSLDADAQNDPMDDWRTNSFAGVASIGAWRYCLNDSMLTSKHRGLRTDEITATAGHDFGLLIAGAGICSRRNYAGQDMQNTWHKVWHDLPLHLDQETTGEQGVAYVLADLPRWMWDRYSGLQPVASALIASNGESAIDVGGLICITGGAYTIFFGARLQLRDGARSALMREIQQHERGVCVQYGFTKREGFGFDVSIMPGSWAGALTWRF